MRPGAYEIPTVYLARPGYTARLALWFRRWFR